MLPSPPESLEGPQGTKVSLLVLPSSPESLDGPQGAKLDATSMPNYKFWQPKLTTSVPRSPWFVKHVTAKLHPDTTQISAENLKTHPTNNKPE